MKLRDATAQVRCHYLRIGGPVRGLPCLLSADRESAAGLGEAILVLSAQTATLAAANGDLLFARMALNLGELGQWVIAHARGELVEATGAWAGRLLAALGDAVAAGLPAEEVAIEVLADLGLADASTWAGSVGLTPAYRSHSAAARRALLRGAGLMSRGGSAPSCVSVQTSAPASGRPGVFRAV